MKRTTPSNDAVHGNGGKAGSALALLAVFALGSLTFAATAAPVLPEVSYAIYPTAVTVTPFRQPGTYFGEYCSTWDGSCAQSSASALPNQVLTVSGASGGSDNLGANANAGAQMTYWYSVDGPSNISVPLRISGLIDLEVAGPSTWMIGRIWYTTSVSPVIFDACASDQLSVCQLNNVHLDHTSTTHIRRELTEAKYSVIANSAQAVDLSLAGNASPLGGPGGHFRGLLDPMITIDPAFLAANPGYSLVFSAGLQPVPVPGAFLLFGSALGALAVRVSRRRA
jgi:hypothetical protein